MSKCVLSVSFRKYRLLIKQRNLHTVIPNTTLTFQHILILARIVACEAISFPEPYGNEAEARGCMSSPAFRALGKETLQATSIFNFTILRKTHFIG